jgi:hypothetical protein
MRFIALVTALAAAGCTALQPTQSPDQPQEIAGRSAGAPKRCVLIDSTHSLRVSDSDRHTLLYGDGGTLWANDLGPGCGFNRNDVLVTEPLGSYHCRGELVRSFDRFSAIPGPSCVLGNFVPYSR